MIRMPVPVLTIPTIDSTPSVSPLLQSSKLHVGWSEGTCNHSTPHSKVHGVNMRPTSGRQDPHDDVIKWKHFPRYCPFARGIHRSPVNSPHKGQWRGTLMFSLICARINGWVSNGEAGVLRRHRGDYDVIVMQVGHTLAPWSSQSGTPLIVNHYRKNLTHTYRSISNQMAH